jgi:hypothetical protein
MRNGRAALYSAVMIAVDGPAFRLGPAVVTGLLVGGILGWQLSKTGALGQRVHRLAIASMC